MKNNRFIFPALMVAGLTTALGAPDADIVIEGNYRLRGENVSFDKDKVVLKHPAVKKEMKLLPAGIKAMYFSGGQAQNMSAKDKLFMANGHRDIIPCTILSVTDNEVQYKDMFGHAHTTKRDQVAGFRLNTLREKGYWQEPLIFDNSWITEDKQRNNINNNQRKKMLTAFRPEMQADGSYAYRLNRNKYPTWARLHKNIGLDPQSFIFRTNLSIETPSGSGNTTNNAILFCFGGTEDSVFRTNFSNRGANRLLLCVFPNRCVLMREQKKSMRILGEVKVPEKEMTRGVEIRLISSRQDEKVQSYELLVGDQAPLVVKDTAPEPLEGNAFGFHLEGYYNLNITRLGLSALTLSAKSLSKDKALKTDLVLTNEEDAIPCTLVSYDSHAQKLVLNTDKEYPGISRRLDIPVKYLDTVFLTGAGPAKEKSPVNHGILLKDGSRLHGTIRSISDDKLILQHPELGALTLPLNNITRVEFINSAGPDRSTP